MQMQAAYNDSRSLTHTAQKASTTGVSQSILLLRHLLVGADGTNPPSPAQLANDALPKARHIE